MCIRDRYTRNDILSASGKVLMEADTLIELKTTDVDGKISFIADQMCIRDRDKAWRYDKSTYACLQNPRRTDDVR